MAANAWLHDLTTPPPMLERWHAEIMLDITDAPARADFDQRRDTRFHVNLYSEEWGFFFCHQRRASWIRITDVAFVHGQDDYGLLPLTPALADIGTLLRDLERRHAIQFRREHALVHTNLASAQPAIRSWVASL